MWGRGFHFVNKQDHDNGGLLKKIWKDFQSVEGVSQFTIRFDFLFQAHEAIRFSNETHFSAMPLLGCHMTTVIYIYKVGVFYHKTFTLS